MNEKTISIRVSGFMIKFKKTKDLHKRFLIPYKGT